MPSPVETPASPLPPSSERTEEVWVTFLPEGVRARVTNGTTLLDAANQAGVYVNSVCGGRRSCGKCRLIVVRGEVAGSQDEQFLTEEERRRGYVLACATQAMGDLTVLVPEESRLGEAQVLIERADRPLGEEERARVRDRFFPFAPLVVKQYVELDPPTIENHVADHERLCQGLRRALGAEVPIETSYPVLRALPQTLRQSGFKVTGTVAHRSGLLEVLRVEPGDTRARHYGLAVDVGTTTVVVQLVNLATGETLAAEATYNSQMRFGEDYIQRIMYAEEHDAFAQMQQLVVGDINGLSRQAGQAAGVSLDEVSVVMCAGNTAMLHFLVGLDPTRIRRDPYIATANFMPPVRARDVGISIQEEGLLFCMPSVAAYIGGDITAGVLVTRLDQRKELNLFIDIGTNGEVVLGNSDWLVAASCSAGPAFEGSGVEHGMRASAGAIQRLEVTADLGIRYQTIGNQPPRGLCGSGLLDTLAELFRVGIIDRRGRIGAERLAERVRDIVGGREFVLVPASASAAGRDITINDHDIANLLRSKAAVYAAISVLVESLHLRLEEIEHVYLAGGFGNYLDLHKVVLIGMLPDATRDRVEFVGNTSLAGAKTALLSRPAYARAAEIARRITYLDLMGNVRFMDEFSQANFLPHTHIEEFPSVMAELARVRPASAPPGDASARRGEVGQ